MTHPFYERLSAADSMFLEIEDAHVHMHMGGVSIFEAHALRGPDGGLDYELILSFAEAQIHKSPRLRQKLATIPWFEQPVWVDDARFNLVYHLRHTALPPPGSARQLKRLAGRILSQSLDRSKPLWETWLVDGLEGDRFAVISKLHHCMADGMSSGDLAGLLMGSRPRKTPRAPAPPWMPRPVPEGARLTADEVWRRGTAPLSLLRSAAGLGDDGAGSEAPAGASGGGAGGSGSRRGASADGRAGAGAGEEDRGGGLMADLGGALERLGEVARGAMRAAESGLQRTSETPLNVEVGPHRRFDWTRLDLPALKQLGRAAGGTLNDAVLSLVAAAVGRFMTARGEDVGALTFRAAVPVNVRTAADQGRLGNRVSSLIVELPIAETDPWRRLERIVETTRELKRSGQSQTLDLFGQLADWLPAGAMAGLSRAGTRAVNMIVTNVPGPRQPIYMLAARMLESYPIVPLMATEALNVAIYSYEDGIFLGFLADWDAVPDLHDFAESVPAELEALAKAALARGHGDVLGRSDEKPAETSAPIDPPCARPRRPFAAPEATPVTPAPRTGAASLRPRAAVARPRLRPRPRRLRASTPR